MTRICLHILTILLTLGFANAALAQTDSTTVTESTELTEITEMTEITEVATVDELPRVVTRPPRVDGRPLTIYAQPLSLTYSDPWWHGLWINTEVLSGAFIGTLVVLEALPEDATSWNRAEIRNVPFYRRWFNNIFKRGPEWDHDNGVFNYILHPYAGAAYFMGARTMGFNFWQSMLYCTAVSTLGWEFGIEACMERPSYQDLIITPIVGSVLGELCYRGKRAIVLRDYNLLGSRTLGHIACWVLDPLNEFIGLFDRGRCRSLGPSCLTGGPTLMPDTTSPTASRAAMGFTVTATF